MLNNFNKKIIDKLSIALSATFKIIFNPLNISKALIIFIFGLVSRILVNSIYDINVFTEYTETISLVYYSIMALFVVFTNELVTYFNFSFISSFHIDSLFSFKSKIYLGCLKMSTIKKAFSNIIYGLENKDKIAINSNSFDNKLLHNTDSKGTQKYSDVLFKDEILPANSDKSKGQSAALGGYKGYKIKEGGQSAGIGGLYVHKGRGFSTNDIERPLSLSLRFKRRLFWYGWKQFSDKYYSFEEFKQNWDSRLGVRKEIKRDLKKWFKK